MSCDFVRRRENAILVGQSGLGKSRIIQAMGRTACVLGHRVRYTTSEGLLGEFTAALANGTFPEVLSEYSRMDLLIIDEFGFDRLEREAEGRASTFYYVSVRDYQGGRAPRHPGHLLRRQPAVLRETWPQRPRCDRRLWARR